jgi:hypothetical protein
MESCKKTQDFFLTQYSNVPSFPAYRRAGILPWFSLTFEVWHLVFFPGFSRDDQGDLAL